ncbi:MAG: 23S rRNA pseudouridine(955/2504/2580) synthase RluC [Enterobacterales bacterium]|nr:23S rRNA pseudouridine(955/2504/2580) synthase RluC [Enterobacterales bacterium]
MNEFDKVQFWTIEKDYSGQRIDNYLISHLKGVPKSRIYRIIRKGEVRVNKGRVKAEYKLTHNDILRIPPIRVAEKEPAKDISQFSQVKQIEASIVFESNQFMVINKPSGIAVHGGSGISFGVIEAIRALRPKEKFLELVHRIDRDTSGCLLIAKRRTYLIHFQNQLRHRKMNKEYVALVNGHWPKATSRVDQALKKTERASGERVVLVDTEGKASKTNFEIIKSFAQHTLVRAKPVTGRTHQIRVHAKYVGCPLLGDDKYSDTQADRVILSQLKLKSFLLHAQKLRFTLPEDEQVMQIEAPLPAQFKRIIKMLGNE